MSDDMMVIVVFAIMYLVGWMLFVLAGDFSIDEVFHPATIGLFIGLTILLPLGVLFSVSGYVGWFTCNDIKK